MTDVAAIVGKMTEAQTRAVMALGAFIGCRWHCTFAGAYRGVHARTLNSLKELGLVWGRENHTSRYAGLLPLGLAVRAYLENDHAGE